MEVIVWCLGWTEALGWREYHTRVWGGGWAGRTGRVRHWLISPGESSFQIGGLLALNPNPGGFVTNYKAAQIGPSPADAVGQLRAPVGGCGLCHLGGGCRALPGGCRDPSA